MVGCILCHASNQGNISASTAHVNATNYLHGPDTKFKHLKKNIKVNYNSTERLYIIIYVQSKQKSIHCETTLYFKSKGN